MSNYFSIAISSMCPVTEELIDLRLKVHIMNAENFLKTKNEYFNLIARVDEMDADKILHETKEKIESIRRRGAYYSIRGGNNFVRYTHNLVKLNNGLRRIIAGLKINI
ncbi:hypothetical protein GCK72_023658 [Caenorhabditis remanei]|uniref:Uncharacterized protein n=1 Tax=Caenorhabditis remanei TaxID=31234 RepID=A0A6A5FXE9_CAERE|nr:hypothetical protein GCK72_023658 [Caenorhabditis remanei]KAF1747197.1 hypothetical protein GCK72_023658 [Caenorhabditis remanei]